MNQVKQLFSRYKMLALVIAVAVIRADHPLAEGSDHGLELAALADELNLLPSKSSSDPNSSSTTYQKSY